MNKDNIMLLKHEKALADKRVREFESTIKELSELGGGAEREREALAYWQGRADAFQIIVGTLELVETLEH